MLDMMALAPFGDSLKQDDGVNHTGHKAAQDDQ
jgi:hypothetical protein